VLALAAACYAVVAGAAAPQGSVDDLVARNAEARGGLARLRAVKTIKQTASMSMMGTQASMTIYSKRRTWSAGDQREQPARDQCVRRHDAWIINRSWARCGRSSFPAASRYDSGTVGIRRALVDYRSHGVTVSVEGWSRPATGC
jgi:hypothetical protein